jgi:uncharacterized phage-associated protein
MANVFDAAAYVLHRKGPMTAMKLQKLVYYAQAWSLVWDEKPLFPEAVRAWANGPVVPELFFAHQGEFVITNEARGNPGALNDDECETLDAVLEHYGDKSASWLSALTHSEPPWQKAREGLGDDVRGNREITHASMTEYYGNI